jgi:hypothetical protein
VKKTIRSTLLVAAAAASLLLASCSEKPAVLRILWEPDGNGYVQFRTNDTADYDQYFYHFPSAAGNELAQASGWTATAIVKQEAGTFYGYCGLIVGLDESNFVGVLISGNQYYCTVSRQAGAKPVQSTWTQLSGILVPPNENTLSATVGPGGSLISFSVNGASVGTSSLPGATMHAGFLNTVLTKTYEGFPSYYSDRRFKLSSPLVYPTP